MLGEMKEGLLEEGHHGKGSDSPRGGHWLFWFLRIAKSFAFCLEYFFSQMYCTKDWVL